MHEMHTTVTDVSGVCPSVCLSLGSTRLHCAKMAKWTKVLFGVNILGGPWNILLVGGSWSPLQRGKGHSMQPSPNYSGFLL